MNKLFRILRYDWPLHFVLLLTNWLPDNLVFLRLRGFMARHFLGSCGADLRLGRNVVLYNPIQINLGSHVYIANGCILLSIGTINIEDEVMLGPYVVLSAGNHTKLNGSYRYGPPEVASIHIGLGSWIGAHSTILGGAIIGEGSIIASNSSVLRGSIPANSLAAGVPAIVKSLNKTG